MYSSVGSNIFTWCATDLLALVLVPSDCYNKISRWGPFENLMKAIDSKLKIKYKYIKKRWTPVTKRSPWTQVKNPNLGGLLCTSVCGFSFSCYSIPLNIKLPINIKLFLISCNQNLICKILHKHHLFTKNKLIYKYSGKQLHCL